jgi:hypothetical protein
MREDNLIGEKREKDGAPVGVQALIRKFAPILERKSRR